MRKNLNKKGQGLFVGIFIAILIVAAIILISGFDTVDASHKGVAVKFGEVKGTVDAGMHWTGTFTEVHTYNLKTRQMTIDLSGANGALDKEGQEVYSSIQINYRLNPAEVQNAYSKLGKDKNLETLLNLEGIVREGFKSVISKYELKDILTSREQIKQEAIEMIKKRFEDIKYFSIDNVVVTNFDFNEAIKEAINAKKTATEQAKATVEKLKIAEAEKQIAVKDAESAAAVKIEQAKASAETLRLTAIAEAEAVKIKAEAEAKALELKSQELTELMVKNNWIDAWNGALPRTMMSGDTDVMLNMAE